MAIPIIKRFLITLDRYKYIPFLTLILGVGGAGAVSMKKPPPALYVAQGLLSASNPPSSFSATGAQIQAQGTRLTPEILTPPKLLEEVANKVSNAFPKNKLKPKKLRENLQVKFPKPEKSKEKEAPPMVITVVYTDDTNDRRAMMVLGEIMIGMMEQSKKLNNLRLESIIKSINERIPQVEKDMKNAEQKLEKYVRTEGPNIWAAQDGSVLGTITNAQQQQKQIQITLGGINTEMRNLQNQLGMTVTQAYVSSALSADLIIGTMKNQIYQTELQRNILSRDLRNEHPTMIDIDRKLQAYNQQLLQRGVEVIGNKAIGKDLTIEIIKQYSSLDPARQTLANKLVTLQTQKETLQNQLLSTIKLEQDARKEYSNIPNKQLEQARLQQQVQIQQTLYSKMQTSLADAKTAQAETVSSITIAAPPQVNKEEAPSPKMLILIGAGLVGGLAVGLGLVFFLSTLDNVLYTPEEIRDLLKAQDVPFLGELPWVKILDHELNTTAILVQPHYGYLEFYERFRSSLRNLSAEKMKVLLFTSAQFDEGKTVTAYNVAIASALAGKRTLLIEANLRSPSQSAQLKVTIDPFAQEAPLSYYTDLSECIKLVPDIQNLYIIPSVQDKQQSASILESSEFRLLLEEVEARFDLIIIDSPSLSSSNDALLLTKYIDGMIMVARPEYTQKTFLQQTLEDLTEAELPLLGVVINGVEKPINMNNDDDGAEELSGIKKPVKQPVKSFLNI